MDHAELHANPGWGRNIDCALVLTNRRIDIELTVIPGPEICWILAGKPYEGPDQDAIAG
jgi:hypothetical protein